MRKRSVLILFIVLSIPVVFLILSEQTYPPQTCTITEIQDDGMMRLTCPNDTDTGKDTNLIIEPKEWPPEWKGPTEVGCQFQIMRRWDYRWKVVPKAADEACSKEIVTRKEN